MAVGIVSGAAAGHAMAGVASTHVENVRFPGALPVLAAATILASAAASPR